LVIGVNEGQKMRKEKNKEKRGNGKAGNDEILVVDCLVCPSEGSFSEQSSEWY